MAVKKSMSRDNLKQLLSDMREAGVLSFEYEGVKVTFDPYAANKKGQMPELPPQAATIDDKAAQSEELRRMLQEAAKDEEQNLLWST